jgi:superfamily I DNA/RNA helicase
MKLTSQQQSILKTKGHLKINAVAGSGKTSTIIEFAKTLPKTTRVLYLGFNKSVRIEAKEKFRKAGLFNVQAETAHSLAFSFIMRGGNYQLKSQGYKIHELAEVLGLNLSGQRHSKYVLANHISKFAAYYCNSAAKKIDELDYKSTLTDAKAKQFVQNYKTQLYKGTRLFLSKMQGQEIEITHDFYLKKFQLSKPKLKYDYILFDEGQDASPTMLDVFLSQNAIKIIVGDEHQQIYGWRHAVNSLAEVHFPVKKLTQSFRFGQSIANIANHVLGWKQHLNIDIDFEIKGTAQAKSNKSKAVLARTNLGLLLKAIAYVKEKDKQNIYFEGNISSYTYADDGTSLYDVLNLYLGKRYSIKDALIREMRNMADLEDYIESTQDLQLGMMVEVVKQYGDEIPDLINEIKSRHIDGNNKEDAEIVFSTVHRSKGMEYDEVQLVNDFITEEKLKKIIKEEKNDADEAKLNEEINLLYVAVTRAKSRLYLPENLIPAELLKKDEVTFYKVEEKQEEDVDFSDISEAKMAETKAFSYMEKAKAQHKMAYAPWTEALDDELTTMYCENRSVSDMAIYFNRTQGAIRSRIKKLELKDLYS